MICQPPTGPPRDARTVTAAGRLDACIQDLQRQIEAADSDESKLDLMRQKNALAKELRELDPNYWRAAIRRLPPTGTEG